jgi:hypothetical protein
LFAIKDGELKPRNIVGIDLDTVNVEINDIKKNNQSGLAIGYDADVLNRKEEQVFLVLSYYLEKK